MKNVIILTPGLAGSSVVAALFSTQNYWHGHSTKKKKDYDTWENSDLVDLNTWLLDEAGFHENWTMVFKAEFIDAIASHREKIDPKPILAFIDDCNKHKPWLWKDPRMWLTLPLWIRYVNREETVFLVVKRDTLQAWISMILRRQIQTYRYSKDYMNGIVDGIKDQLAANKLNYLEIAYEDLLKKPDEALVAINQLAGSDLHTKDLQEIYSGRLYHRPHGVVDFLKACAIYLNNYRVRYR